ncbi:MAG TPA: hypothetical protein PKE54_13995, partial [Candidatus Obscuribacter sp.]|nr:hypothetical protein [Candidatus Obscuribacter sp.]
LEKLAAGSASSQPAQPSSTALNYKLLLTSIQNGNRPYLEKMANPATPLDLRRSSHQIDNLTISQALKPLHNQPWQRLPRGVSPQEIAADFPLS